MQIEEKAQRYKVEVTTAHLDEQKRLKPYACQMFFEEIAEKHLVKIGLDSTVTLKHHLGWAIISISIEFIKPVVGCQTIYARTWYSQKKGPFYRRELEFFDEDENLLFHGSTFSVLLDLDTRTVFAQRELPFEITEPIPEFTIKAFTRFRAKTETLFEETKSYTVKSSDIDALGHVNNCRYGELSYEMIADILSEKKTLERMEVYFQNELRMGDSVLLAKACEKECVIVHGEIINDGRTSFDTVYYAKEGTV